MMDKTDYSIVRRFIDLSRQADTKGIVLFSDFLNMNEINLLEQNKSDLCSSYSLFGGYEYAERQMVAFQPDALYYNWEYPIVCIKYSPVNLKFSEELTHRDVLGALMHLGIERGLIGDIIFQNQEILIFCQEKISSFLLQKLIKIKHTQVIGKIFNSKDLQIELSFKDAQGNISSNRLDAFVAQSCKLSRAKAAEYILGENVFINGKLLTNHNAKLSPEDIVSLRGYGKLIIREIGSTTRKGRIWVSYQWYQ